MIELVTSKKKNNKPNTDIIKPVYFIDKYSTYPSSGLTPERLASIFKEADQGYVQRQMELYEEIIEKDGRLLGMYGSRRDSVMKNDYQIQPASGNDTAYKKHAEYASMVFDSIKNLREAKKDILDAVPKGFSASWIDWVPDGNDLWINTLNWINPKNFRWEKATDPQSSLNEIRLITPDQLTDGAPLEPNKWVVSVIKARSGHPSRTGLLRTNAWMYLFKNFSIKSWVEYAELFWQPIRLGKYKQGTGKEEIQKLADALRQIGRDASGVIPDTMSIEFAETAQKAATASLHGDLAKFCNAENSVAVLGHTAGAESTPGKLGGEDSSLEAKHDLVESDALALDYYLTDHVIVPLIKFKFGEQRNYPTHKTLVPKPVNRVEEAQVISIAVNDIGVPVSRKYVYNTLNIPEPQEDEDIVTPRPQNVPVQGLSFSSRYEHEKVITGNTTTGSKKKR